MGPTPDLSIIIVNWNSADALAACLRSITDGDSPSREIIIVDNASTDDSVARVRSEFPGVSAIANSRNVGFAAANNQALAISQGRFLLLLNPDTVVRPGALAALCAFMDAHPEAGIIGPRFVYPDGTLQPSGHPDPTLSSELADILAWNRITGRPRYWHADRDYRQMAQVDTVSGAALLIRHAALEQIGLLDAGFFMYYEDVDWCLRARQHGWAIYYVPQAEIVHHRSLSSDQRVQPSLVEAYFHSRERYFRKHQGLLAPLALRALLLVTSSVKFVLYGLLSIVRRDARVRDGITAHARIVTLCLGRSATAQPAIDAQHV